MAWAGSTKTFQALVVLVLCVKAHACPPPQLRVKSQVGRIAHNIVPRPLPSLTTIDSEVRQSRQTLLFTFLWGGVLLLELGLHPWGPTTREKYPVVDFLGLLGLITHANKTCLSLTSKALHSRVMPGHTVVHVT